MDGSFPTLRVLVVGTDVPASPWGPFEIEAVDGLDGAARRSAATAYDAVLLAAPAAQLLDWPPLSTRARATALVACCEADPASTVALLAAGVQDVVAPGGDVARAVRLAAARHLSGPAFRSTTDPATGLPGVEQLREHMSHLLALREREPAPMALIALQVAGLDDDAVLRRKAAVRLRAALRASDVVASIGADRFGVLLGSLEAPGDGAAVAAKLVQALHRPVRVAGQERLLAARAGVAAYPEDGRDADTLLARAAAALAPAPGTGRHAAANDPA